MEDVLRALPTYSISPFLRRLSRRAAASDPAGASTDADEAFALWSAVLDGALPELELGALLVAFSLAGESPEELLGLHRALAARQARFAPGLARRAVSLPVCGLVPGEAAIMSLLALFLRRFDVPVVLHGPLESMEGPSAPVLLRELGVIPSATLADAERELRASGIAFVSVQLLSPALGDLLALHTRPGVANAAQLAAQAMDPGGLGAVRLAMRVPASPTQRLATFLAVTGGEALLLSWPAAVPECNFAFRPGISLFFPWAPRNASSKRSTSTALQTRDCRRRKTSLHGCETSPIAGAPAARPARGSLRVRHGRRRRSRPCQGDRGTPIRTTLRLTIV